MTDATPEYCVLVVEDDPHTQELLQFTLAESGYRVIQAESGDEAIRKLRTVQVDLIISDVMMPGMDGFEFREHVMEDPVLRRTAFLFLTAKSNSADQIRGIQSGVDEYITKPFDIEVLLARVEAVIARREQLARAASVDPLTQLLNRAALERAISRELSRLRRYPSVAALIFLDIDDFKPVNDTYGHAAGDRVLQVLAEIMRQDSRSVDIVGRYGGEEFLLFFPETTESEAKFVVERMLDHFKKQRFEGIGSALSFSAGIAEAPRDGETFEILAARADAAMYHSKHQGKAQITVWRPEFGEPSATTPA